MTMSVPSFSILNLFDDDISLFDDDIRLFYDDIRLFDDDIRLFNDDIRLFNDDIRLFNDDISLFYDEISLFNDDILAEFLNLVHDPFHVGISRGAAGKDHTPEVDQVTVRLVAAHHRAAAHHAFLNLRCHLVEFGPVLWGLLHAAQTWWDVPEANVGCLGLCGKIERQNINK